MRKMTFMLLTLVCFDVRADMTGAVDAAILSETVVHTGQNAKSLEVEIKSFQTFMESLDISKRIEKMEQLKTVKQLSDAGRKLNVFLENISDVIEGGNDLFGNKLGLEKIKSDAQWLNSSIKNAETAGDVTHVMIELKNLRFLGQMVTESKKNLGKGTNDLENKQITAINTTVISDLMLRKETEDKRQDAQVRSHNDEVMKTIFKTEYSNLNGADR